MRLFTLLASLFAVVAQCSGQGTIHIRFDSLPDSTSLNDQFASQGIVFLNEWRYTSPVVSRGSNLEGSVPFSKVAVLSDVSRNLGIFSKNLAIASISLDIALNNRGWDGALRLFAYGYDNYPATTGVWGGYLSSRLQNLEWVRLTFTAPETVSSKLWEFNGENILNNANYGAYIYIGDMDITFVPEPSAEALVAATGLSSLLWMRRIRLSSGAAGDLN